MQYNLKDVFKELSIKGNELSDQHKTNLLNDGYTVIKISEKEWQERGIDINLISEVIDELIEKEGSSGGWDHIKDERIEGQHPEPGAQRLNNLINKHKCFRKLITLPEVLCASKLLMKNEFRLSQIILRMPFPGKGDQP